jgi:hypothetical protein
MEEERRVQARQLKKGHVIVRGDWETTVDATEVIDGRMVVDHTWGRERFPLDQLVRIR